MKMLRHLSALLRSEPVPAPVTRPEPVERPEHARRNTYSYLGNGRAVTLTHAQQLLMLDTRDIGMTPHLAMSGEWERDVEDTVVSLLRPGAAVVEVGANIGYHTLAMAAAVGAEGRIHSFEPNPRLVPLLRASVALNGFDGRVQVHPQAASDATGEVTLAVHPDHAGSGHLAVVGGASVYSEEHRIASVRIDDVVGDALRAAQLMRLDCEGAEPLALRGAEALIRRSPDIVLVLEWSVMMMRARTDVAGFVAWLESLGFRKAWRIEAQGRAELEMAALPSLPHCELILARSTI